MKLIVAINLVFMYGLTVTREMWSWEGRLGVGGGRV